MAVTTTHRPTSSGIQTAIARSRAAQRSPGSAPSRDRPVRVVVADDSYLMREALGEVLAGIDNLELVASVEDGDALLAAVDADPPDIVITDIRMPPSGDDEGIRVARRLRESHPDVGVIALSQYVGPSYGVSLLEGGADGRGYLLKERIHDRGDLAAAIDVVAQGGTTIDPTLVRELLAADRRQADSPLAELTPREREVLAEIAKGKSNAAIADTLVLTKRAVEKHINSIFLKLNLSYAEDVSKRVKATLLFLADSDVAPHA